MCEGVSQSLVVPCSPLDCVRLHLISPSEHRITSAAISTGFTSRMCLVVVAFVVEVSEKANGLLELAHDLLRRLFHVRLDGRT